MARRWFLRVVEPTWQTSVAGSSSSCQYIESAEVRRTVVSTPGSSMLISVISDRPSR